MLNIISRALGPIKKQLRLTTSRVTLNRTDEKGLLISQVEGLEGETLENVERLENYGFAGRPPAGSEGVMLAVGGSRDHPVMVGLEHREHRPELADGESALYSMFKQLIHLDKEGNIVFTAPKGFIFKGESFTATLKENISMTGRSLAITAPEGSNIAGGLSATGNITSESQVQDHRGTMQNMRDVFNPHTHPGVGPPSQQM